jgi:hypothetical protein
MIQVFRGLEFVDFRVGRVLAKPAANVFGGAAFFGGTGGTVRQRFDKKRQIVNDLWAEISHGHRQAATGSSYPNSRNATIAETAGRAVKSVF